MSVFDPANSFVASHSTTINFEADLPEFKTDHGVLANGLEVTAPTLMFVRALDMALSRLQEQGCPFEKVTAISGSGQQHGSVYWKTGALETLQNLSPAQTLAEQLKECFSLSAGPIWEDSSTTEQCRNLETRVGSAQRVADISGSRAYERFTGNQIAKIFESKPSVYDNTERICLVSSFLACLFLGDYAPIDVSDGSGMNLLDITTRQWSTELLAATAPNLLHKLGDPVSSHECVGSIHQYFVARYNFNPDCKVIAFSGDNPCSLAGLMVSQTGNVCVSLGTSDTLFGITDDPRPSGVEGHILCSPIHEESFMAMLCFKNGSVTREHIRDATVGHDWDRFSQVLTEETVVGNNGNLGFYFLEPEIIPPCKPGTYRFNANDEPQSSFDNATDIRGLVESQFLSMRAHCESIGVTNTSRLIATGGASRNKAVLQVLADVFGCEVVTVATGPDTATSGAALRALQGLLCLRAEEFVPFHDMIQQIGVEYVKVTEAQKGAVDTYTRMLERRRNLEATLERL